MLSVSFILVAIENRVAYGMTSAVMRRLPAENKFVCQEFIVAICCLEPESVSFQERGGRV